MQVGGERSEARAAALLEEAWKAFVAGDVTRCLDLCRNGIALAPDRTTAVRLRVTEARVLAWHRRYDDVVRLFRGVEHATETDEDTALEQVLLGRALAGMNRVDEASAVLDLAERNARTEEVLVESALARAYVAMQRHEFAQVEELLARVPPSAGYLYPRALEYRAYAARYAGDLARSSELMEAGLRACETVTVPAQYEDNLLLSVGCAAPERLDFGQFAYVKAYAERVRRVRALSPYAEWMLAYAESLMDDAYGRPREALTAARRAVAVAPSPVFRLIALCRRAAGLYRYSNILGFEDLAASLYRDYERIPSALLYDEEGLQLPTCLAENLAQLGDPERAARILRYGDQLPARKTTIGSDRPDIIAQHAYVEGLIADASGDALTAGHRYRTAFETFRKAGFIRRAMMGALRLGELTSDAAAMRYVEEHAQVLAPGSWIRVHASALKSRRSVEGAPSLTRAEREVLQMICDGKSTAEIASLRNRSPQTIRNTVSRLFTLFSVDTRTALVRECVRKELF